MKSAYAYLKTFDILNVYWQETKLLDLGSVLSGMNPDPLYETPYLSSDPGAYADWNAIWARLVGSGKEGTAKQVAAVAHAYLRYYEDEVGYKIGDAASFIAAELGVDSRAQKLTAAS